MKTYDPKRYKISFGGIPLNRGLADGTFLTITPASAGFTVKVGADGEVTRARNHNRTAEAKVTIMQTSLVNDQLSARYEADRQAVNGAGVGAFLVKDLDGTTVFESSKAFISRDPDVSLGLEAETREWTITLSDYTPVHGSNLDN